MNLDPTPRFHLRGSFAGGGTAGHEKFVIVVDGAVFPLSCVDHSLYEGFSWTLPERRVFILVVDLVGPFADECVEVPKRPHRLPLRIDFFGELARSFGRLGITQQIVDEFRVAGAKEPLNDGTVPWFRSRSCFLDAGVASDQRV